LHGLLPIFGDQVPAKSLEGDGDLVRGNEVGKVVLEDKGIHRFEYLPIRLGGRKDQEVPSGQRPPLKPRIEPDNLRPIGIVRGNAVFSEERIRAVLDPGREEVEEPGRGIVKVRGPGNARGVLRDVRLRQAQPFVIEVRGDNPDVERDSAKRPRTHHNIINDEDIEPLPKQSVGLDEFGSYHGKNRSRRRQVEPLINARIKDGPLDYMKILDRTKVEISLKDLAQMSPAARKHWKHGIVNAKVETVIAGTKKIVALDINSTLEIKFPSIKRPKYISEMANFDWHMIQNVENLQAQDNAVVHYVVRMEIMRSEAIRKDDWRSLVMLYDHARAKIKLHASYRGPFVVAGFAGEHKKSYLLRQVD
ncbi:hypothetical protein EPUL_005215, partial [Erysiphe pulchra]